MNNNVAEMMEKFCWKSKTRSVWKDNPDLLDHAIARIHSEAAVFDAILRSKNTTVPSLEKITRTVQFLEQNSFWRSNPFSLVSGTDDDPALARATSRLQMKSIRDLWHNSSSVSLRNSDQYQQNYQHHHQQQHNHDQTHYHLNNGYSSGINSET